MNIDTNGDYNDEDLLEEVEFERKSEAEEYANIKYGKGNTCIRWIRKNGNIGVGEYEGF